MPPRRSARVAAVAERATTALAPLPLSIVLYIFALLPVDVRARAAAVCRCWRAAVAERSLWTRLELRPANYDLDPVFDVGARLLRGAAARAGGDLRSLHVDLYCVSLPILLEVAAANAGALEELHVSSRGISLYHDDIVSLLRAAPRLRVLSADVQDVQTVHARAMLRNEAPFEALRVCRTLSPFMESEDEVIAFAADVVAHPPLQQLYMVVAPLNTSAALDAVVDAVIVRKIRTLTLIQCDLSTASTPALVRLLGSRALTTLVYREEAQLLDVPASDALGAALRANTTLTSLSFEGMGFWRDIDAAAALLHALVGHPSVRDLSFYTMRTAQLTMRATQLLQAPHLGRCLLQMRRR
jgi:hypothetical protein